MRLRLNSADSLVGTLMVGDAVGEVIESRAAGFVAGDIAMGNIGWQEYGVLDAGLLRKIDPSMAPISTSLGILGMPGLTAYFGLFEIGRPIPGDTVVVSAASGAVGAVVGQLAKLSGCRVIGIAGTDEKIRYVVDQLGFDAGLNYKSEDIPTRLGPLCPDGIDIYWDNVGGELADAAIEKIAKGGRAVICGQIAQYNATSPPQGPRIIPHLLLSQQARMEGFWVGQFEHRNSHALDRLSHWVRDGALKYKEDVAEGIENSPAAFIGLLNGANLGKLVVQLK
jgi:NADPH-dependent curcumin reductase CurA